MAQGLITENEGTEQNDNESGKSIKGNKVGRSGGTPGSADNRDPNDEKVMATSPDNMPGRQIEASLATLNRSENSPISAYYEFPSSKVTQYDTYPTRMKTIQDALGNKDSVKG